jgi:cation transport ATPase
VIVRDDLGAVPAVISLSRRARKLVAQSLVIAGVFIAGLIAWDLACPLPLLLGVAGPSCQSTSVSLSMVLRRLLS